jgi:hypothetical protein
MPTDVLFEDEFVRITLDRGARLVRYVRSERPFPTIDAVGRVHTAIVKAVLAQPRGSAMLIDLRRAPARNDDAYEAAIEGYVTQLIGHFDRWATLVKTAAGRLQVTRLEKRANRPTSHIYYDEALALAHITGVGDVTKK